MSDHRTPDEAGREAGFCVFRLIRRAQFLETAKGVRVHRPSLTLQRRPRGDGNDAIGFGFTVTKKEGNAVARNRIRRRFRAAAAALMPLHGAPGCDYVIIGRAAALDAPFPSLLADLKEALADAGRRAAKGAKTGPRPSTPAGDAPATEPNAPRDA